MNFQASYCCLLFARANQNKLMKRLLLGVTALYAGLSAYPQDSATSKALDEVVVTAQKFPMKTSQTGKIVLVITREQLEQSGGKDLAQVLNEQAGLYINGANSNPGKDKSIYLRGARIDHTLITIDGIPVYDPSGIGGNFDIRNLSLDNIERIEILKGSQSTLYGSDAIAGVINFILRKEPAKKTKVNSTLSYGSNQTRRGQLLLEGKWNQLNYYAGYSRIDSRGINETVSTGGNNPVDRDDYHQQSTYGGIRIAAGPRLHLQPFFRHTLLNGSLDQGSFVDELDYTYQQKNTQAGIKNVWQKGKTEIHLLYSYQQHSRSYTDDSTKSRNGFSIFEQGNYGGREQVADLYTHFPVGTQLRITLGSDYRYAQSSQSYQSLSEYGSLSSRYGADSLNYQQWSVYASSIVQGKRGLSLEGGFRLHHHSVYGNYSVGNLNPSWLIRNRFKLFANFSSAYRTPSLFQLFSEYGNRNLNPEAAWTTEAGIQFFSKSQQVTARLALFSRSVRQVIFFYFNPNTFAAQYINQDRQADHGSELELTITPSRLINIRFFHTYVTGQLTTRMNAKDTTYFNLLRRPKHSMGLQATANLTPKLTITTNLNYYSKRWDAYYDAARFTTVSTELAPYFLWDLYAAYRFGKNLRVFMNLRNITHSRYTEVSGFNTLRFNAYGGIQLDW